MASVLPHQFETESDSENADDEADQLEQTLQAERFMVVSFIL